MNKELPRLASLKECTGCAACIDACHHNALSYVLKSDGHYYVQLNKKNVLVVNYVNMPVPLFRKHSANPVL